MFEHLRKLFLAILCDSRGWTTEMSVTGVTEIDAAIPNYWAEGIVADGNRESFWGQLAGKEGSLMPIIDKTGPLKKNGDALTFNTIEQLMGTGVTGESVLKGQEEKLGIGTFTVTADVVRQAVSVSRKSTKQANFDEVQMARTLLKDWFSRKFDNDVFTTITDSSAVTTLYANSKTAVGSLNETDGDYFGPTEINLIRMALIRQGATPLKMTKTNGRSVPVYGIVFGEVEDYWLNQNTSFVNTIKESWERFKSANDTHPLFNGAIGIFRNMILYPYYSLLQIPQGTPLRPETTLSATLATTDSTIYVGVAGDANTKANYTLFFASSGSLQIDDEIITYTSKTVSTFVCGATRGVSGTTAAQHSAGALVTQRDVSTVIGFGAQAVFRALPEDVEPIGEKDDYGEQIGLGVRAYYGHGVRIDKRRAKSPSLVMCKCISPNPGTV